MADNMAESEYLSVAEAREALHVSRRKIAALIAGGILPTEEDPLDKRYKLIKRADVEALAAKQLEAIKGAA